MPRFGERSLRNMAQLHPKLQTVLNEAIKTYDFTIICGNRGRADQEEAFRTGKSKAHFGQSPHNYLPALAADCIPYPFVEADWKDEARFAEMARAILAAGDKVGVPLTWGGDWKMHDTPHFELRPWRDFLPK
jgi:peptidoglycan LD-endopeptidase CwlK